MLIEAYKLEITVSTHSDEEFEYEAIAQLDVDIREVLPYLNSTLDRANYVAARPSLAWRHKGHNIGFWPDRIAIDDLESREHAQEMVDWLVNLVNDTWARRDEIEPTPLPGSAANRWSCTTCCLAPTARPAVSRPVFPLPSSWPLARLAPPTAPPSTTTQPYPINVANWRICFPASGPPCRLDPPLRELARHRPRATGRGSISGGRGLGVSRTCAPESPRPGFQPQPPAWPCPERGRARRCRAGRPVRGPGRGGRQFPRGTNSGQIVAVVGDDRGAILFSATAPPGSPGCSASAAWTSGQKGQSPPAAVPCPGGEPPWTRPRQPRELIGVDLDDLFPEQRAAQPLDQIQIHIHFVGTIHCQVQAWVFCQAGEGYAKRAGVARRTLRRSARQLCPGAPPFAAARPADQGSRRSWTRSRGPGPYRSHIGQSLASRFLFQVHFCSNCHRFHPKGW